MGTVPAALLPSFARDRPVRADSSPLTLVAVAGKGQAVAAAGAHPFDAVAREHHDALLAFAVRISGNPAEGKDLVQDTFERALKAFDRLAPGSNARAWLFTILNNAFLDRCRSRAAAPRTESLDGVEPPPASEPSRPKLSSTITAEQLRAAIDRLPPDFRAVYVMHALDGCSYQEIAAKLGLPMNTVGTRLARARRKLREILLASVAGEEEGEDR